MPQKKEEEGSTRLTFDMPRDLHRRLRIHAINTGKSMRELILDWIRQQLEKSEKR